MSKPSLRATLPFYANANICDKVTRLLNKVAS